MSKPFFWASSLLVLGACGLVQAQDNPQGRSDATILVSSRDSAIIGTRAVIEEQMRIERAQSSDSLRRRLDSLNLRIAQLDERMEKERDEKKRVSSLVERVQILETKEQTAKEGNLRTYQNNYASGVINLIFMEREIKPLILFNASRDFFSSLNEVSNPMTYPGYQTWFREYQGFMDKTKNTDANMQILTSVLSMTGDLGKSLPLNGPVAGMILTGINTFIGSLSPRRDQALRERSVEMFQLTTLLSQFTHERDQIENEWDKINKELEVLQKQQVESLQEIFETLGLDPREFDRRFTRELDHSKIQLYVGELRERINNKVRDAEKSNPQNWRSPFFRQMQKIQSLKLRFGQLTFRIQENTLRYNELIEKYNRVNNNDIKAKMADLRVKLTRLTSAFDAVFQPQQYIQAASTMYDAE